MYLVTTDDKYKLLYNLIAAEGADRVPKPRIKLTRLHGVVAPRIKMLVHFCIPSVTWT